MITQSWNINEEEKNRILRLHENATKNHYLTEQFQTKNVVDFGSVFPSGEYELGSKFSNEVNDKVQDIVRFIKGKNLKSVTIEIESGESRVTNQAPFTTPGSLAEARANSLKSYLQSVLPKLINFKPNIIVKQPIIGSTPYKIGDNKDDPSYTKEQFVRANIISNADTDIEQSSSVMEPIYLNKRIVALINTKSRDSKSIASTGNIDISRTDLDFNVVKKDSTIIEKTYKVPWQWWNKNVTTNEISQENYDYIINTFPSTKP
jgi:hypothetical protein